MIRSTPTDRAIVARAGWPVARLLVGLGLVVALLMGCWAATHSETAASSGTVVANLTADGYASETGDLDAALCLLGVACMLALVVLAWRAPSRTYSLERVAGMVRELIAVPLSRTPVLTLTQLRVCRT